MPRIFGEGMLPKSENNQSIIQPKQLSPDMMPFPPAGKISLLQQLLVTSKIMLNQLQTVNDLSLTTVVMIEDMVA